MKKLIQTIIVGAVVALFGLLLVGPAQQPVAAIGKNEVCAGLDTAIGGSGSTSCDTPKGSSTVEGTVATLIRIFSWVVGVASVIMVIVGGFQYVTSGGDSGKVSSAKNTIMYALIGIVIVALSQVIVNFVLSKV